MAPALNVSMVAEGVEAAEQAAFLLDQGARWPRAGSSAPAAGDAAS